MDSKKFDYVIVGAGPAAIGFLYGVVERYSSSSALPFTIVVLERGEVHDSKTIPSRLWPEASQIPSSSVELLLATVGSRELDVPVGKGLGGGTNVNACLALPPSADDFKTWPSPWKDSMMSSIHKIQDAQIRYGAIREFNTSIKEMRKIDTVAVHQPEGILRETTFPSFISRLPLAIQKTKRGEYKRKNYYDGILEPLLKEHPHIAKNITFLTGTRMERLYFDGRKVTGVECRASDGRLFDVHAFCEVILSAGALETPALLLASGIGKEKDLEEAGIPSLGCDLPVGHNLKDHVMIPRVGCHPFTSYDLAPAGIQGIVCANDGDDRFQFLLFDASCGPFIYAQIANLLLFRYRVKFEPRWLSTALNLVLTVLSRLTRTILYLLFKYTPLFFALRHFGFATNTVLLNPASKGRVRVSRSKKCVSGGYRRSDLRIDVEDVYLSDARDVDAIRKAWAQSKEYCGEWFKQGIELLPSPLFPFHRADLFSMYVRGSSLPYFHWSCSCAMGSVTDSDLRVKGMGNLRICDASCFATIPSAPTALTCAGLGYKLSAMMFENTSAKKKQ